MKDYFNFNKVHPELTVNVGRNNKVAVVATFFGAVFISQTLFASVPGAVLASWFILLLLASLFRLFTGFKLLKCHEMNAEWRFTSRLYILTTTLVGLGLGVAAVLAEIYGSIEEQLFVFAMLIGFSGGAVATLAPMILGYILHVFAIMLPQILALFLRLGDSDLFASEDLENLMAYMGLLYMIVIIRAGMILHENFYESIQLKEELAASKALAESANNAKSKFLSSVSHELRTPLHAIMGSCQMLEIDETLDTQKKQFVDLIKQAGNHLLSLIDQILEYAKIEAGKVSLDLEKVSLQGIVRECEQFILPTAQKQDVSLSIAYPETDLEFISDPLRLKQVLLNLMSNAIKYNKENGKVSVTIEQDTEKLVKINIIDTGFGIPEEKQPEMFVSFNRLGRESGEQQGTGIGLVICKDLIEAMGGSIDFTSKEGQGSHFWILLDPARFSEKDINVP